MSYRQTESGLWIDDDKADFAVNFIGALCHTKGEWYGQSFNLLPWQEQIIRDVFGTVNPKTGYRQYLPEMMSSVEKSTAVLPTKDRLQSYLTLLWIW